MSFSQFSKLIKALMFAALMVRKKLLHEANCPGKKKKKKKENKK